MRAVGHLVFKSGLVIFQSWQKAMEISMARPILRKRTIVTYSNNRRQQLYKLKTKEGGGFSEKVKSNNRRQQLESITYKSNGKYKVKLTQSRE